MDINFICVGTQKAGTTTLHDILKRHPDIFLPENKEAHFFEDEDIYENGLIWWKNKFFSNYCSQESVGVFTPEYLYYDKVPNRIYNDLGSKTKIIIILRNPVDRAYSHYLMEKLRGYETASFERAIESESARIKKGKFYKYHFSYLARGLYFDQLNRYYDLFKSENILVLNFENDVVMNLEYTVNTIQSFLGVKVRDLDVKIQSNRSYNARLPFLNRWLNRPNWIKKVGTILIRGKKNRSVVRKVILRFNRIQNDHKLPLRVKHVLLEKYFMDDIRKVETKFNLNLKHWYENS